MYTVYPCKNVCCKNYIQIVCCCGQGSLEIGSSLTGYLTLNCSWKTQLV